jgi:hypothetical protein
MPCLTLDAAGVVRKVNGAAARILQRGAEELVGRELDESVPGRNALGGEKPGQGARLGPNRHHHRHRPDGRRQRHGLGQPGHRAADQHARRGDRLHADDGRHHAREAPAQHHVALHEQVGGGQADGKRRGGTRRHRPRRQRAVLRHPRLHLDLRAPRRQGNRGPAQRILHRHGGHRLRPQRRARQVHRRHDHGGVRLGAAKRRRCQQCREWWATR